MNLAWVEDEIHSLAVSWVAFLAMSRMRSQQCIAAWLAESHTDCDYSLKELAIDRRLHPHNESDHHTATDYSMDQIPALKMIVLWVVGV